LIQARRDIRRQFPGEPQAAALKKIYAGPHDLHGQEIFPDYLPGAEDGQGGWGLWITGQNCRLERVSC